jgi:hypothetical protein
LQQSSPFGNQWPMATGGPDIQEGRQRLVTPGSVAGLVVLLAVLLPVRFARARIAASIWCDEIYSLLLSAKPLARMVDLTAFDAHPPLYYFLLHSWLKLGSLLGAEGILWARSMGIVAWAIAVCIGWFGGRYLLGRNGGVLFAVMLAISPQLSFAAKDLRNYMPAMTAILACHVLLLVLYRQKCEGSLTARRAAVLWGVYALSASVALWLHLLCSLVIFLLGLLWIWMSWEKGALRHPFFRLGLVAQVIAALGFVPWLLVLPDQLEYIHDLGTSWMSKPTGMNFLFVFLYWLPHGRLSAPDQLLQIAPFRAMALLQLLPAALGVVAVLRLRGQAATRELALHATAGLLIPFVFVCILWGLAWFDLARGFEGARYPALALPIWTMGLCAAAILGTRSWRWPAVWPWVLAYPWVTLGLAGEHVGFAADEGRAASFAATQREAVEFSGEDPIYVAPSLLLPCARDLFPGASFSPIEQLGDLGADTGRVRILFCEDWMHIQDTSIVLMNSMIKTGKLADSNTVLGIPSSSDNPILRVRSIEGNLKLETIRRMAKGDVVRTQPEFSRAISVALPEKQYTTDGYQTIEVTSEFLPLRWTRTPEVRIRFDRPIPKGRYNLFLSCYRQPCPSETVEMTFRFEGSSRVYRTSPGSGAMAIQVPFEAEATLDEPVLHVTHPVWQPRECIEGSTDPRRLGFYFGHAWIEGPAP